jgi:type II secretory pathway component PulF
MAVFTCRVADSRGNISEFTRESSSEDSLLRELQSENYHPLRITAFAESGGEKVRTMRRFPPRVILDFTETLGLLLSSGLSLKDALQVALSIFTKGNAHRILGRILDQINKGVSFYNALVGFGDNFPPLYRGLVRIGEKIGSLDSIFIRLARYLTENKKIKEKVGGALIYPLIILIMVVGGSLLMTFVAFPAMAGVFAQLGSGQAEAIKSRLVVYNIIMGGVFAAILLLLAAAGVLRFLRKQWGQTGIRIDALLLKLPVAGTIVLYQESMNFLFAMETLTGSGYSIEEALLEASLVLKNQALKAAVSTVRERVIRGDSIAEAFREQKVFPERISQWLLVGERSGQVEKVFSQLNTYYQGEIDKWTTRFMALIEPALMVCVGVVVLLFVLLFLLPIYTMYSSSLKN